MLKSLRTSLLGSVSTWLGDLLPAVTKDDEMKALARRGAATNASTNVFVYEAAADQTKVVAWGWL